ncbi:rhomboid family intramembrane serine protease [Acinetobacter sp. B5B]|uniref:rhomboid family intramembrane serine protease n=1 Tax=Acinetobacter baretiae TaxID=2605383 RepID=UPI0018C333AE|nr:rhomboid family intramembrane serine protease [Acinetobacter baretiae]MBF7682045.1 rhomboid family intramembrane serine protease [Acinetobacter baretiae]
MLNLPFSHSITIIIITVVISLIALSNQKIMNRLIFWPPAIQKGQFDRFITHGFVHADGMHLLFNMITLYFFGRVIEVFYRQYLFNMGFVFFYLGALIIAILPSYLKHKNDFQWASLGASGAVSAVLFSYILFKPWSLILVFIIPVPAIIFALLYIGYSIWAGKRNHNNTNHSAHLWGAAYGVVVTILVEPNIVPHFLNKLTQIPFL